jgi:hypothetical protein
MASPNLFDFATSELSQDAFLCWLLSWAHRKQKVNDSALHQTAVTLLGRLLDLHGIETPAEYELEVKRQHKDIDILVLVNDDIALPVEDKVHAAEHGNQLTRYREIVLQDFPGRKVAPVYFKTGDQSNFAAVKAAGWKCFLRADLLKVLEYGKQAGVTSDIFRDFHCRLRRIEEAVQSYRQAPIGEWDRDAWTGFFIELQKRLNEGDWGYVPFPGDFMGFWWHWLSDKDGHRQPGPYLQLEEDELCFKIHIPEKANRREAWRTWHQVLMGESSSSGLILHRVRPRYGNCMTVSVLDRDYREVDDVGILDVERTVQLLRRAMGILDSGVAKMKHPASSSPLMNATGS